ncbi:MAG: hypothetical protein ACI9J3_001888 [Parvicellaceae bacterium]|jgi:hypothetical protein
MNFKKNLIVPAFALVFLANCTPLQVVDASSSNSAPTPPKPKTSTNATTTSSSGGDFNFKRGVLLSETDLKEEKTYYAIELSHPLLLKDIDLSKIYKLSVNLDVDQKEVPEIVYKLKNLQFLEITRLTRDYKTNSKLPQNHIPMNIESGLENLKNLQRLNLYYFTPLIKANLVGLTNLNSIYLIGTKLNQLPASFENSTVSKISLAKNDFQGASIGKLPKTLKSFEYRGEKLSDDQLLDVVNQVGAEVLGENIEYVDKRFVFDANDDSMEKILGNKKMVVKLTIGVDSKNKSLIDKLPEFQNLKHLNIYYNKKDRPTVLPQSISKCTGLTFIKISNDRVTNYESLASLSKLKTLYINGPVQKLPETTYPYLERLVIQYRKDNNLKLPEMNSSVVDGLMKKNKQIESIELWGTGSNKYWFSIKSLEGCVKLKSVILKSMEAGRMPDFFGDFKDLYELKLEGCTHITDRIGEMQSLKFLNAGTKQEELPASITQLKKLKSLRIGPANNLKKLPDNISKLEALETLELMSHIHELPLDFTNFKNLKKLDLFLSADFTGDLNPLKNLKLETLKLSGSSLRTEVKDIEVLGTLTKVKDIELVYLNFGPKISDSFCKLSSLESFTTVYCLIESIPECFGNLPKLKKFKVGDMLPAPNLSIPESFFTGLKSIKKLELAGYKDTNGSDRLKKAHPKARVKVYN